MSLDEKISALTPYTTPIATDFFPIVDITTGETKKIDFSLVGGGDLTPWTEDIDAAGFDLTSLSNLEFQNTTGAPAGTVPSIWVAGGDMNFNVATGDSYAWKMNGGQAMFLIAGQLSTPTINLNGNDINEFGDLTSISNVVHNIDLQRSATLANDTVIGELRFRSFNASASPINYAKITGVMESDSGPGSEDGSLKFFIALSGSEYLAMAIDDDRALTIDMFLPLTMDGNHINGIDLLGFNNQGLDMPDQGKAEIWWDNSLGLIFNVPPSGASDNFIIKVVGTNEYTFNETEADWNGNDLLNFGFLEQSGTVPTSGTIRLADLGGLQWQDGGVEFGFYYSETETGYILENDVTANWNPYLSFHQINTAPTSFHDVYYMDFYTYNSIGAAVQYGYQYIQSRDFTDGSENGAAYFAVIIDGSIDEYLTVNSADKVIAVSMPILFAGIGLPVSSGQRYIATDSAGFFYNVSNTDVHDWTINAVSQMTLSATELDLQGNNIVDLSNLEFQDTASLPSADVIYIAHNGAGSATYYNVPTNHFHSFRVNGAVAATISSARLDMTGKNIDNVQNIIHDLSTSGTDIDFDEDQLQSMNISANTTFTGVNYAIGRSKTIYISTDGTLRTLTFPSGWKFMGAKPADQAASKVGVLTLDATSGSEDGVRCAYAVEE